MIVHADGTNRSFHHARTTGAAPEAIWAAWMDVAQWKDWDIGLSDAVSDGPLRLGTRGTIRDRSGRSVPFEVTAFEEGASYTIATPLPLGGRLTVARTITGVDPTTFRHHVRFEGLGGRLLAPLLGRRFRRLLPEAMDRLAHVAERGQSAGTAP